MKACIVGYGAIGPIHANALSNAGIDYVVCDCNPERLKKAESLGIFTSFDEALRDASIDTVHICTPHHLHVPMALAALEKGRHVVLEKPVGINPDEVKKLFDYQGDREICIMLQNRKNPGIIKMKELIDSKAFGKPLTLNAFLTWHRDEEYYAQDEWRGKWATEGGGLMINQAVHTLDLLCWLGGGYKKLYGGIATRLLGDCIEVEDTTDAVIETNSGIKACFYATNCSPINSPIRIEAAFNDCVLSYCNNMLILIRDGSVEILEADAAASGSKSYWGLGHQAVIKEFYSYLDGKTDNYSRLEYAKDVTKALFDLYKRN